MIVLSPEQIEQVNAQGRTVGDSAITEHWLGENRTQQGVHRATAWIEMDTTRAMWKLVARLGGNREHYTLTVVVNLLEVPSRAAALYVELKLKHVVELLGRVVDE